MLNRLEFEAVAGGARVSLPLLSRVLQAVRQTAIYTLCRSPAATSPGKALNTQVGTLNLNSTVQPSISYDIAKVIIWPFNLVVLMS